MDAEDIVLGIVKAAGGAVLGRTYLQKVAYFASEMMGIPMGFGPHYYGPYSSPITSEIASQVAMGRLKEIPQAYAEGSRIGYRYELEKEGMQYLEAIGGFEPEGFHLLSEIVSKIEGADYKQLACAAKLHYLLQEAGGKISRTAAKEEAKRLGWHIEDKDIDTAIRVLQQLDLAS